MLHRCSRAQALGPVNTAHIRKLLAIVVLSMIYITARTGRTRSMFSITNVRRIILSTDTRFDHSRLSSSFQTRAPLPFPASASLSLRVSIQRQRPLLPIHLCSLLSRSQCLFVFQNINSRQS